MIKMAKSDWFMGIFND